MMLAMLPIESKSLELNNTCPSSRFNEVPLASLVTMLCNSSGHCSASNEVESFSLQPENSPAAMILRRDSYY